MLLLGAFYIAVGIGFGALSAGAPSAGLVVAWRRAAWLVSGVAFGAHIAHDLFRLRLSPSATALHAALAAALGACGLAVAAVVHSFTTGTGKPLLLGLAILAWPALTAVPAFLVAWVAAAVAVRVRPGR
jgi:hypothetical protein